MHTIAGNLTILAYNAYNITGATLATNLTHEWEEYCLQYALVEVVIPSGSMQSWHGRLFDPVRYSMFYCFGCECKNDCYISASTMISIGDQNADSDIWCKSSTCVLLSTNIACKIYDQVGSCLYPNNWSSIFTSKNVSQSESVEHCNGIGIGGHLLRIPGKQYFEKVCII